MQGKLDLIGFIKTDIYKEFYSARSYNLIA